MTDPAPAPIPARADATGVGAGEHRPFGVHLRMGRWRSLLVLVAAPVTLLLAQLVVFQAVVAIEGPADPSRPSLTPLAIVATGASTAIAAALMTALVAAMARVPWRSVLRHGRGFDWRRLATYLLATTPIIALGCGATAILAPATTGWSTFEIGATTVAIVAATLVFTPLQAAGEEVSFRGAVVPAAGSWLRGTRLPLVAGIAVSWILFAVVHVSLDPWFLAYLLVFSTSAVLMGVVSGGLEAAMAFHVANNVLFGIVNAVFAGGGATVVDRAAESGPGPAYVILMAMDLAVLAVVWLIERRSARRA